MKDSYDITGLTTPTRLHLKVAKQDHCGVQFVKKSASKCAKNYFIQIYVGGG